jgi:hypothetical protein
VMATGTLGLKKTFKSRSASFDRLLADVASFYQYIDHRDLRPAVVVKPKCCAGVAVDRAI